MNRFIQLAALLLFFIGTLAVGERLEGMSLSRTKTNEPPAATETAGERNLSAGELEDMLPEGEAIYRKTCARCHENGVSGAPKLGDRKPWEVRIASGIDNMVRNAIEGYQGNQGVHPPRGGDRNLTDAQIEAAVRYMVSQVPPEHPRP